MRNDCRILTKAMLSIGTALALASCGNIDTGRACARPAVDPFVGRAEFFPLAIWYQPAHLADSWVPLGINTLLGNDGPLTEDDYSRFASLGLEVVPFKTGILPGGGMAGTVNLLAMRDEPDNAQKDGRGGYGPCRTPKELAEEARDLRRSVPGRSLFVNFGQGIANPDYVGRGSCSSLFREYYTSALKPADVVSFDHYPVTRGRALEEVAEGARTLASFIADTGCGQTQWGIIESSAINGGAVPTPAQMRAMAWMHVVNGARGLVYFPYEFGADGSKRVANGTFAYPELIAAMTDLNRELTTLAPAIKSPDAVAVDVAADRRVTAFARRHQGATYIFAVREGPEPQAVRFGTPLPAGVEVEVLGESRRIVPGRDGFDDRMHGYAVRIYRIAPRGTERFSQVHARGDRFRSTAAPGPRPFASLERAA